ncbi:MAG TPA: flagellar biosynthesis anti-sigma factor FlgM [Nevskiaceae bacterium]|nr:flagellar biosynthesis anti-sigma factor FlgM [Nevskiaceae bacterium]
MNKITQLPASLITPPTPSRTPGNGSVATPGIEALPNRPEAGDRSSLGLTSPVGGTDTTGPVFDRARVDAIRHQIAGGQYTVNPQAVAGAMLAQSQWLQDLA